MSGTATEEAAARTPWLVAAVVVVVGAVLGISSELAGDLPRPWYFAAQLGAPWLVAAFLVARACRRPWTGALVGVAVVGTGLLVVAIHRTLAFGSHYRAGGDLIAWAVVAVVMGSVLGAAGAGTHDGRPNVRAFAWSIPVAVALVESALTFARWSSVGVSAVDLVLAAAVFALGARRSSPARLLLATGITLAASAVLALLARVLLAGSWGQAIRP